MTLYIMIALLVLAGSAIIILIASVRKYKMDFNFIDGKATEAETAVTAAFTRVSSLLTAAPTPAQLQALATKLQNIVDAANAVAPAPAPVPAAAP